MFQLESYYRVRLQEKRPKKSKQRYLRKSRVGSSDVRTQGGRLTEEDYLLRLFYTTYRRLLRVNHVLDYAVRLSWLTLAGNAWP